MNRVRQVVDNLNVGERIHPDDVMQDLLEVLEEGASPTIGGISLLSTLQRLLHYVMTNIL